MTKDQRDEIIRQWELNGESEETRKKRLEHNAACGEYGSYSFSDEFLIEFIKRVKTRRE